MASTAIEMQCGRIELITPIPTGTSLNDLKTASTTFTGETLKSYKNLSNATKDSLYSPTKCFEQIYASLGSLGGSYKVVGVNQQTGKVFSETWDGSSNATTFGSSWDEGYYRVHVVYYNSDTQSTIHLEKMPMYWNKSQIYWMTLIKAGQYICGSPATEIGRTATGTAAETQHLVILTNDFYLQRTAMTNAQYNIVTGSSGGANTPKVSISQEAIVQTNGLMDTMNTGIPITNYTWNLPTEAQWEYACRAGVNTGLNNGTNPSVSDGSYDPNIDEIAWYKGNNSASTAFAVALKKPNRWGFYDMEGNVWEWLVDYIRTYSTKTETDPTGTHATNRADRGGRWGYDANHVRCAGHRNYNAASATNAGIGLRPSLQYSPATT